MDESRCTILAMETSCDETSAAVVRGGREILSHVVASQASTHAAFGGVVPEIASREHIRALVPVVRQALAQAGMEPRELDAVAVTHGPGLVGALLVGVSLAKSLAYALEVPLVPVHHLAGHLYASFLADPPASFPLVCLVVSGGHTSLVYWEDHPVMTTLGKTRDDAAGEAFDKVARLLGLGYPGGPAVEAAARTGDPAAYAFPRVTLEGGSLDFSFSGLKSAVMQRLAEEQRAGRTPDPADVAASFQAALVDVLVSKTVAAARRHPVSQVVLAGGVAANTALRDALGEALDREGIALVVPPPALCTDNAAMIGVAAFYRLQAGVVAGLDLNARAGIPLGGPE